MKALRIIGLIICTYFLVLGGGLFISKAAEGEFHLMSLIMALAAAAFIALIIVMWIRSAKKTAAEKLAPRISKQGFDEKYNNKLKMGNAVMTAIKISIGLIFFAIALIVLGYLMVWDFLLNGGIVILIVSSVSIFVTAIVYGAKYEGTRLNSRMLMKKEISLEHCLEGIENESSPMVGPNKIICADNAMIFSKQVMVMPYSCVYWVYRKNYSVNFIPVSTNIVFRTIDGNAFEIHMDDGDIMWILNHFRNRFPRELAVGYGREQAKIYKQMRKQYRKQG